MCEQRIRVTCAHADDGGHHQIESVPASVVAEYERNQRPHLCYLCRVDRIASAVPPKPGAQDHNRLYSRNALYDSFSRLRDDLGGGIPDPQEP